MSTDSIEAAYKALGVACWWKSRAPDTDEGIDFIANEQAAARALMLAVLDEAFAVPALVDSIYVARKDVDALRAKIAVLGNGGEGS